MLDVKYVVANPEAVKENCRNRNAPADVLEDVDRAVALEGERRETSSGRRGNPPPPERESPRPPARSATRRNDRP